MENKVARKNFCFLKGVVIIFKIAIIIVLLPFVLAWIIKNASLKRQRKKELLTRIEVYDMSQIDSLSGVEFERLLQKIFELQGYVCKMTKGSHDYGADLVLNKKGKTSIVQAKCYGHNVGIKAIQEIVAAKGHYKASDLFVATNRYFSKDATILAIEHGVKLIDRDVLHSLIKKFKPTIIVSGKRFSATLDSSISEIETKYRYWI